MSCLYVAHWMLKVVDEDEVNADDLPDDMEAISMGDKCLMYRSSILEVGFDQIA